ncbi:MAG: nuclear transport factor 2 family protein [Chitinivibrionia bacterium]|nr:nuclear transport factor 2 family protein [Chitinivibrionia bacterium]
MKYPTEHFAAYQEALNLHSFDGIAKLFHKNASFCHSGTMMTDTKDVKEFHENFWNTIKQVKWWATDIKTVYQDDKCEIYAYQYNYIGTVDGEQVEGNGKTTDVFVKNGETGKWEFLHAHSSSATLNHDD